MSRLVSRCRPSGSGHIRVRNVRSPRTTSSKGRQAISSHARWWSSQVYSLHPWEQCGRDRSQVWSLWSFWSDWEQKFNRRSSLPPRMLCGLLLMASWRRFHCSIMNAVFCRACLAWLEIACTGWSPTLLPRSCNRRWVVGLPYFFYPRWGVT